MSDNQAIEVRQGRPTMRTKRFQKFLWIGLVLGLVGCGPKVEEGVSAYQAKDYNRALDIFRKTNDDPVSLFHLYLMALGGQGREKDEKESLKFLTESANKGHPRALMELGSRLLRGDNLPKNETDGFLKLKKAVDSGLVEANTDIGIYYISEKKLPSLGIDYLQAADKTWRGQYELAAVYADGRNGIPVQADKALKYLTALLENTDAPTQIVETARFQLAEFSYYGFGVKQDFAAAAKMLQPIVDSYPDGKGFYAWMLFRGEGVPIDTKRAVELWQTSNLATDVYRYATYGLALAYLNGTGVPQDIEKSKELFSKFAIFDSGALWQLLFRAKGLTGKECDFMQPFALEVPRVDRSVPNVKGKRYASLAATAYQEYGACLLKRAAEKKNQGLREHYLGAASGFIRDAESLGAVDTQALSHSLLSAKAGGGVAIGMTAAQVLASKWGRPQEINRTQNAAGTTEQWVYGGQNYLYFENGVLTAIQN